MRNFEEIYEKMNKETAQFVKDRYEFCLSKRKTFEEKAMLVSEDKLKSMEEQRRMILDSCKDELKCLSDSYDVLFCGVDAYRCDGFIEGEDEMEIVCMVVDEVKSSQFSFIILDECRILRGMSKIATEQALAILRQMNENRESFRKIGLTFEEKAFYDILISLCDQYNFEYGTDKEVDGVIVNDKCKALAKKIKDIIDTKSSFADWLNNQNVRNGLKLEIKICLVKNGYPPQYSPEVFNKVMEQVENFEEYSGTEGIGNEASTSGKIYEYKPEYKVMMVAEDSSKYGDSKNNQ